MLRMPLYLAPLLGALAVFGASPSLAITYTTIDFPGSTSTRPQGIFGNEIVGTYVDSAGTHGYLQIGSTFTTLAVPSSMGSKTNPRDIDANGDVVGYYTDQAGVFHGFKFDGTNYTTIDNPNGAIQSGGGSRLFSIDGNKLAGDYFTSTPLQQGAFFDGSTFQTVSPGSHPQSAAFGLSGNTVVGVYFDTSSIKHGMIFDGTTYSTLDFQKPNEPLSAGYGTELRGIDGKQIVGTLLDSDTRDHGYYYDGTKAVEIVIPGAVNVDINGISNNVIVGTYSFYYQLPPHGFMAVVPEPTSIALLATGAIGLAAAACRRGRRRTVRQAK